MLVADAYLGTVADPTLRERLDETDPLAVTLDDTARRRSRVRTTAADGTPIGIVVGRELRNGDVLEADGTLVVVSLASVSAMVVDFGDVGEELGVVVAALRLGHAVGNRHWDLVVHGSRAYVPATDDRERMEAEVRPHLPEGAAVAYEDVSPAMFDDATVAPDHGHAGSNEEDHHGHTHDHDGDHDHKDEHPHPHNHEEGNHHPHDHGHHSVRGVTDAHEPGGDGA